MDIDYEQGLERLKQYLRDTAWEQEFLVYQARLRENLDRERRYGTNEQIRSDRALIIDQLNRLALQVNTTFNDLCLNHQTPPEQTPTNIWNVLARTRPAPRPAAPCPPQRSRSLPSLAQPLPCPPPYSIGVT
jgi:hypothetical protein